MRRAVGLSIAVGALTAALVVALGPALPTPVKKGVDWLRGYPAWLQRAALAPEPPPFGGLAASQVGYGPSMVKQFSSPERFASFQVMSTTGEVAFEGGPPVREVRTDALGAVRTVWVGDFTPVRAPGRIVSLLMTGSPVTPSISGRTCSIRPCAACSGRT